MRHYITDYLGLENQFCVTETNGNLRLLAIKKTDNVRRFVHIIEPDRPEIIKDGSVIVIDARGAKDGANSIVKTFNMDYKMPYTREVIRVRNTPDEFINAFREAGIKDPLVKKSIGRHWRDIKENFQAAFVSAQP